MKLIKRLCLGLSMGLTFSASVISPLLSQVPPYGPLVNGYNEKAWSATQKGDYDTAIINYQRAAEAAKNLTDTTLRDCGLAGAMANIQGAQAAKSYLKEQGLNSTTLKKAQEIENIAFRAYWDELEIKRPDLANSCP